MDFFPDRLSSSILGSLDMLTLIVLRLIWRGGGEGKKEHVSVLTSLMYFFSILNKTLCIGHDRCDHTKTFVLLQQCYYWANTGTFLRRVAYIAPPPSKGLKLRLNYFDLI